MATEQREAHCWAGARITEVSGDEWSGTCLKLADHEWPHEFVRNEDIQITFAPEATEARDGA